jgi:hypothetical protein
MSDEQRSDGAPTDEERARAVREQLKSLHAFDLAYEMMISLVSFGYQKMGLTDETRELRDLGDARLAIELLRANLEVVEREQGADRTRDVRSTLAQMQLGYAQAVHLAGEAPATRPQASDSAVGASLAPRRRRRADPSPRSRPRRSRPRRSRRSRRPRRRSRRRKSRAAALLRRPADLAVKLGAAVGKVRVTAAFSASRLVEQ